MLKDLVVQKYSKALSYAIFGSPQKMCISKNRGYECGIKQKQSAQNPHKIRYIFEIHKYIAKIQKNPRISDLLGPK